MAKEKIRRRIWYNRQREEVLQSPEEITLDNWWITGKLHPFFGAYWFWYGRCCTGGYLSLPHRTEEKSKRERKPKTIKRKNINSFTSAPALYLYWAISREKDRIWTARKLLKKDRNNNKNAHNNSKDEEGLLPHKSRTSQRKSYVFLSDEEQRQSVAKTPDE